jgi:hypothetical protein
MADPSKTKAQLRRAVHDRFINPKAQEAISEAIYSNSAVSALDRERIVGQFANRLNDYLDVPDFKLFRQLAVEWCGRQAALTAILNDNLNGIRESVLSVAGISSDDATITIRVLYDLLPTYTGPTDDSAAFVEWATTLAVELARQAMTRWTRFQTAEPALYTGIWSVFRGPKTGCLDFDTPSGMESIADDLALNVMTYFLRYYYRFSTDDEILQKQLCTRGKYAALAWRKNFLTELKDGTRLKPVSLDAEDAQIVSIKREIGRDQIISKGYPIKLGPGDDAPHVPLPSKLRYVALHDIPI